MIQLAWMLTGLGSLILLVFGAKMPKWLAGFIGCASVGLAFIISSALGVSFLKSFEAGGSFENTLTDWFDAGGLRVGFGFHMDALQLVMVFVVTFIGFLIHLYASQSMADEDGYARFFGYMNLFVTFMLILVLADNLLMLYLGWEGVGLCSYLLIGFWYKDRKNGIAAQKAFIVTRVGDTAMAIGLFMLYTHLGTLNIQEIVRHAALVLDSRTAAIIAVLLLAGAMGKSAQIPLHVWLPDAMAGPTPVSALIHAATMVTAGVYLIARLHPIFLAAPSVMLAVAVIGAATALYAGLCALAQSDIKRVLAYSTISQIGYMFLALGVGAWGAAIFHLMTHAFFKALLFLSAGVVIDALHHEHSLFKMGGMAKKVPVACWTFMIGAASLSSLPLVTAGFFSKDSILWYTWASRFGSTSLEIVALLAALLTALYSFRAAFLAFLGPEEHEIAKKPGALMNFSLIVLAFFAITAGYVGVPSILHGHEIFAQFIERNLPPVALYPARSNVSFEIGLMALSSIIALVGLLFAGLYYKKRHAWASSPAWSAVGVPIRDFLAIGMGFDWLYSWIFVRPFLAITRLNRRDFIDGIFTALSLSVVVASRAASATESGRVRTYAAGIALGAIICAAVLLSR